MNREFEEKFYKLISKDIKKFFYNTDNIAESYEDCIDYLEEIISVVTPDASNDLLNRLYLKKEMYQRKYNKVIK